MKITIRLIVSLLFAVALVAAVFSYNQFSAEKVRLTGELERRTIILAEGMHESIIPLIASNSIAKMNRLVTRFGNRERLKGITVYDRQGNIMAATPGLAPKIAQPLPQVVSAIKEKTPAGMFIRIDENNMYLYVLPVQQDDDKVMGALTLFHDASYIDVRLKEIWRYNLISFLTLSFVIVVITLLIVRWSITGPIAMIAEWTRELRKGKISKHIDFTKGDILALWFLKLRT